VLASDISFICVGTPSAPDGSADLRYVEAAARAVGKALRGKEKWHLVAVRSTVPPGTTGGLVKRALEEESGKRAGEGFGLCAAVHLLSQIRARGLLSYHYNRNLDKAIYQKIWDRQWLERQKTTSFLEKVADLFRTLLISRFVTHYVSRYFQTDKVYVEAGCGSGGTSIRLREYNFTKIGLDISLEALKRAKQRRIYDDYILADIFAMPFRDESIAGLWNVGVMEHFRLEELIRVFNEFYRILKKDGCCLFFWPWVLAPSHIVFRSYEIIMKKFGRPVQVYPPAPSMFSWKLLLFFRELNRTHRFMVRIHPPWMDLIHVAVIVIKKSP
jgi:SAM-dependent methyltransferase